MRYALIITGLLFAVSAGSVAGMEFIKRKTSPQVAQFAPPPSASAKSIDYETTDLQGHKLSFRHVGVDWVRNDDPDCAGHDGGDVAGDPQAFYPQVCKLHFEDADRADRWYAKHHPGWTAQKAWAQHERAENSWKAAHTAAPQPPSTPRSAAAITQSAEEDKCAYMDTPEGRVGLVSPLDEKGGYDQDTDSRCGAQSDWRQDYVRANFGMDHSSIPELQEMAKREVHAPLATERARRATALFREELTPKLSNQFPY